MLRVLSGMVSLFAIVACDVGTTAPPPEAYRTDCIVDDDCVLIPVRDRCQHERCGCAVGGAINIADEEQAAADFEASVCVLNPLDGTQCLCAAQEAFCDAGSCSFRPLTDPAGQAP